MKHLKYPIGKYQAPDNIDSHQIETWIAEIAALPAQMKAILDNMSEDQLNTTYRPGGWTIKQVVHHVVDSHMNSYIRFKWGLTEDRPTIKAYHEDRWAELPEAVSAPIAVSLNLLTALHVRWVLMLKNMTPSELQRVIIHPAMKNPITLGWLVGLYAWHGKHHLGHLKIVANL